ncbi:hypothetical protein [Janthinobacterium lividum]|uniref:hypothetical protein n=1 Tax=Janthinobacterium lividum TaxID=29581 RepID=UPI001FD29958|nr:hypothetical protein [Janthinobacterium lividum]
MKIDNLVDAIPIEAYKNKEEGLENKKKPFTIHLSAFYTSKKIANLSGLLSVDIKDVETQKSIKLLDLMESFISRKNPQMKQDRYGRIILIKYMEKKFPD